MPGWSPGGRHESVSQTVKAPSRRTLAGQMLRIRVLGDLAVELDGEQRSLPPGRAAALLGWLALNPGLHPRARLAPLFWPEVLDSSARASLRTAVWELRRSLGSAGGRLETTRDRV